ncbi:hypothetical protein MYFR107205_01835 [Mycolicibacterium frederiksbergense]
MEFYIHPARNIDGELELLSRTGLDVKGVLRHRMHVKLICDVAVDHQHDRSTDNSLGPTIRRRHDAAGNANIDHGAISAFCSCRSGGGNLARLRNRGLVGGRVTARRLRGVRWRAASNHEGARGRGDRAAEFLSAIAHYCPSAADGGASGTSGSGGRRRSRRMTKATTPATTNAGTKAGNAIHRPTSVATNMTGGPLIVALGRRAGVEPPHRRYTNWPFPWNGPPLCSRR